jgi:hypothetical protein
MPTTKLTGPRQILRDALTAKCILSTNPIQTLTELAAKAGIGIKSIARASIGGPLSTVDHLRLCCAVEVDPMAGFGTAHYGLRKGFPPPSDFDFDFFALGLKLRQRLNRHPDDKTCREIGIKHNTLTRLKLGYAEQIGPVLRACAYIRVHPFGYLAVVMAPSIVSRETAGLISAV